MNALTKKSAVLYHYPCPDGAFAALAAHLYFSAASLPALFFPNTVYDPIRSDSLPLHEVADVYLLDYVGPSGFVAELSSKVESVTILDHHKSAFESLCRDQFVPKNVTKIIDMNRSGATIAFDFFKDKLSSRTSLVDPGATKPFSKFLPDSNHARVHRLFKYIEDGDLWKWQLPNSKAFSSGLKDLNIEYNVNVNLAMFDQLLELDPEHVISHGQKTLLHMQKLIDEALERSYTIALGNGRFGHCLAVDADCISNLRSELGNQLADKSQNMGLRGIGAVVYNVPELQNDEILKISLRSMGLEDTTAISQEYGGGGHRNASSFMLRSASFKSWKLKGVPNEQASE